MKIVFIIGHLSKPRCIKRVKSLLDGGHDVEVYGYYRKVYDVNQFPSNIKVYNWGAVEDGKGYLSRLLNTYKNLKQVFKKFRNEKVIYYCFSFESALIMALFTRNKYICEKSDLAYCYFKNKIKKNLFKKLDKFIIKKSYITVLTSAGFYEYLYNKSIESKDGKFIVQPNKLPDYFINADRKVLSVNEASCLRFAYIGHFRYPNTVFRFAKVIGEKFPNYQFSFYGDSHLTNLVKELADKYPNVHYYGKFRNPEDLASIYENVDIVAACYDIEEGENEQIAEPNKLYEAICFCKPIIVSKHTYLSKRVKELGVGFEIEANKDENIVDFLTNLNIDDLNKKSIVAYNLSKSEYIDSSSLLLSALK